MRGLRNWAVGSVIAALILLSPIIAALMVISAELLIDLLMEARLTAVCIAAAGVIGWVLSRKRSSHPDVAAQSGPEHARDEAAIAVPPV
jgi:hypothetical protein